MMIDKLVTTLKNYRVIILNAGYLSIIEILRLIMPFIALPYIISTIGAENYGMNVFVQTIISYFILFINWGLDISAVKDVSVHRDDSAKINEIVSTVLGIKFILLLISFAILFVLIKTVPFCKEHSILFYFAFITCFSDVLNPVWFYMGIEKMKYITIVRFVSILFYTISIFVFIKDQSDSEYVILLQSLGNVLSGLISIFILLKVNRVNFVLPTFIQLKRTFIDAVPFFLSRLSVLFYESMSKIVTGLLFPMQYVAAMDIANKISMAGIIPIQMMNNAIYPHIAKTKDRNFTSKYFRYNFLLSLIIAFAMFILAPIGVPFLAGGDFDLAIALTKILAVYTLFCGMSTYVGTPLLVSFGFPKPFNLSVIYSSFLMLGLYMLMLLFSLKSVYAFAGVMCVVECFVLVYRLFFCLKYKLIKIF